MVAKGNAGRPLAPLSRLGPVGQLQPERGKRGAWVRAGGRGGGEGCGCAELMRGAQPQAEMRTQIQPRSPLSLRTAILTKHRGSFFRDRGP